MKLVAKIASSVEAAFSKQDLIEVATKGFEIIVSLANTIQSSVIIKAVKNIGLGLRKKIKDLSSNKLEEEE